MNSRKDIERKILLNPGPATTTDSVKQALVVTDICPREKEFQSVMHEVRDGLVRIIGGEKDYTCVLFTGSGTAAMEACVASCVPNDTRIAIVNNGVYGQRLLDIAKALRIPAVEIKFPWGSMPDCQIIEELLASDPGISVLAMVHHETTTGILNPSIEVGKITKRLGRRYILDAMSSYAGIPIIADENCADFIISSSNKCIQAMAGISFVLCRKEALSELDASDARAYYLNLKNQYDFFEKTGQMQFTPPVQILYGLKQALVEFFAEGAANKFNRYTESWKTLRNGMLEMGFQFLLPVEWESRILTTIIEPTNPKFNFERLHDAMYERGFTIYPGRVGTKNTFRLSVLGAIDSTDIKKFLHTLREVGEAQGFLREGKVV